MTLTPSLRLKNETRAAHEAAEQTAFAKSLTAGTLSRVDYASQLVAYRALHEALESAFDEIPTLRGRLGATRSAWCAQDLEALGEGMCLGPAASRVIESWQSSVVVEASRSRPALLGYAYVMEGSALGSAFLAPRLEECLGLAADELHYYRGHGRKTMHVWQEFRALLDSELASEEACEAALEGAKRAFGLVTALLEALSREAKRRSELHDDRLHRPSANPSCPPPP